MNAIRVLPFLIALASSTIQTDVYRLPSDIIPTAYKLSLTFNDTAFANSSTFYDAEVIITLNVTQDNTTMLQLHSNSEYINISTILIDNVVVSLSNYTTNTTTDILSVYFNESTSLSTGVHYLLINYTARISNENTLGVYKTSYNTSDGETKYLLSTQLAPTFARRVFPCFDEPAFKATFDISLTYPSRFTALSNTAVNVSSITETNYTTSVFNTTPKMSTYLVAFIVSDFNCTDGETIEDETVPYSVCSRENTEESRDWAVEIGPKLLRAFNSFTGINYSVILSKTDQVAVPNFLLGATENWGLVTYMESSLLWDANESSISCKQDVAITIAHEFSHQWFGNLVTMKWWSELFLSEGLATFFEYFITHEVLPEWKLDKQFVVKVQQNVYEMDSYASTSPLQSNVSTTILSKFDTLTYEKGASIFRMVQHILGASNFKSGLKNYLSTYQYDNTEPEDLWNVFNETLNATLPTDFVTVMENWVKLSGYPVLNVSLNGSIVTVTQQRFLYSGNDSSSEWYVPLTYTTSSDSGGFETTFPMTWLVPGGNVTINLTETPDWIIFNNQQTGYYRVNYDANLWSKISSALSQSNFSGIHVLNRAQIIDDAFTLARTGQIKYAQVFEVISFLQNDTSYYSWYPAFTKFAYLLQRIGQNTTLGSAISAHVMVLMENLRVSLNLTSLNETDHVYTLKQVLANEWACKLGHSDCVAAVKQLYEEYRNTSVRPNKNLREMVYCNVLRYSSNSSDWEFLWSEYQNTTLSTENNNIIAALGCTTNQTLLETYLLKAITNDSGIRSQDRLKVFSSVYGSSDIGVETALTFLIKNYETISERFSSVNLVSLFNEIATCLYTQEQITKFEQFVSNITSVAANKALLIAEANLQWMQLFQDDLLSYYGLSATSGNSTTSSSTNTTTILPDNSANSTTSSGNNTSTILPDNSVNSTTSSGTNGTTTENTTALTDAAVNRKFSLILAVVIVLFWLY